MCNMLSSIDLYVTFLSLKCPVAVKDSLVMRIGSTISLITHQQKFVKQTNKPSTPAHYSPSQVNLLARILSLKPLRSHLTQLLNTTTTQQLQHRNINSQILLPPIAHFNRDKRIHAERGKRRG